jgi:hypothetical protein
MPELGRGDPRVFDYPPRKKLQMPKLVVDILRGDYYHPEHSKGPPGIPKSSTTAAIGRWPFSSRMGRLCQIAEC